MLPSDNGTMMNQLLVKLCLSTGESWFWLAFPETLAIAMIEANITYRRPTVLNNGGGLEFGHAFMVLVLQHKDTEKLRSSSECGRFWSDAGVTPDVSGTIVACGPGVCEDSWFVAGAFLV